MTPRLAQPAARPAGHTAVMASTRQAPDSLSYFPTPPWATRALFEHALVAYSADCTIWEPAAGAGHMVGVLKDYCREVFASDVHDYGAGYAVGSFVGVGGDVMHCPERADWVITNPPFPLAAEFAERGLAEARRGVALLVRTSWLEGGARYRQLFSRRPPSRVAVFSERVPMHQGRWVPDGTTATSYSWVIWDAVHSGPTELTWIPPGCRKELTRPDDVARFAELGNIEG